MIVPAYNEEAVIGRCLDALLAQTEPIDEILVVDNNSTDRTADIVRGYRHRGVRLLSEPRQGLIPARDHGFDSADGDVLGRIDADTVVEADWAARLREVFADPTVAAATGPSWFHDAPLRRTGLAAQRLLCHRVNRVLSGHPMLWGSNMALSRVGWEKLRGHTCPGPDIFEDLDLAIHLHRLGLRVHYAERLRAATSIRRLSGPAGDLRRYLRMWPRTYRLHGQRRAAAGAVAVAAVGQALMYPTNVLLVRPYSPDTGGTPVTRFFSRASGAARPLP
ncbi:Glycosyltransferases, probably involved in cell wall biogenesis [Marinactinospora thermotolerans DSM 45154]|uniref:Glycosyltransferases, probably involved in cell wall biogenesis n=1 Tax=Marinactinospora thermotolerans DSM 45154 TaxID=1122192 RepID=A0A1T4RSP0_9ACTN|nr:Glycosyltransferases, probably involved in cell wall biogenesis [Marinactinospora thermotolerans DSM 45154]